jgi:hypothetical protein
MTDKDSRLLRPIVVDGGRCIGHLFSRGLLGVEVYDAEDRSLGLFPTNADAAAAVLARTDELLR